LGLRRRSMEEDQRNQPYMDWLKDVLGTDRVRQRWLHGLHTGDVDSFLKRYSPSYIGCVDAKDLANNRQLLAQLDLGYSVSALISTSDGNGGGKKKTSGHWQVIYVIPGDHVEIEFFDSYGLWPTEPEVHDFLDEMCDYHAGCYSFSQDSIQDTDSNACGYHCCYYILLRDCFNVKADQMKGYYPGEAINKDYNDCYATLFCEYMLKLQDEDQNK
jgi:hypothetical protein